MNDEYKENSNHEFLHLLWDLYDDRIDALGGARLDELLVSDPDRRRAYVEFMQMVAALEWERSCDTSSIAAFLKSTLGNASQEQCASPQADDSREGGKRPLPAPIGDVIAGTPVPILPSSTDASMHSAPTGGWQLPGMMGPIPLAIVAIAMPIVLVLGAFVYRSSQERPNGLLADAIVVAEIQSVDACVWGDAHKEITAGFELVSGDRLELLEGVAKLAFRSGTVMIVESPASVELLTARTVRLDRGTVAVRVEGPIKEFVVTSREASIVDLGTSFGVHCDDLGITDVEVFEGAVQLETKAHAPRVLGVGASARVMREGDDSRIELFASAEDRFAKVMQLLWSDISDSAGMDDDTQNRAYIVADFDDSPVPGTVDTFNGATRGRGWRTPWVGSGNPIAETPRDDAQFGIGNPFLKARFYHAFERVVARHYGSRAEFDPSQPHMISWQWRLDGNQKHFGGSYDDRVHFYGNPCFRRNTKATASWQIGVIADHERGGERRKVYPMHWYVFDVHDGKDGQDNARENMIDTGMRLKFEVVYHFAVAVYPQQAMYDVAIRDDERTFVREGLQFRNRNAESGNVVHFGLNTNRETDDLGFSLDSLRIEPLTVGNVEQRVHDYEN